MWTLPSWGLFSPSLSFDLNYVGCELVAYATQFHTQTLFDLNYVGCEQSKGWACVCGIKWFDLNYVGCELNHSYIDALFIDSKFDLNYVGCERRALFFCSSNVICLIWTMWDVNNNGGGSNLRGQKVWSELCGMWTLLGHTRPQYRFRVWSELCGMWTEGTLKRNSFSNLCLIWTMWDVNLGSSVWIGS